MKRLTRRQAMTALAAGGAVVSAVALTGSPRESPAMDPTKIDEEPKMDPFQPHPVLATEPLPASGPWPTQDPFLFCVHHNDRYPAANADMGPDASLVGRNIGQDFAGIEGWNMYHGETVPGFPRHPHRGFETVTVVRQGLVDHSDSLGAAARYGDGDVQWLTAGDGINHAEMFPLLRRDGENPIDFFQIWLNLPAANKRVQPHFSMFWAETMPKFEVRDAQGKRVAMTLVAGHYGGRKALSPPPNSWAAQAGSDVAIWNLELEPHATWTLPPAAVGTKRNLYVVGQGPIQVSETIVAGRSQILLRGESSAVLRAQDQKVELLLLQGAPIGEPVARYGPFVMNTRVEIEEAFRDYRRNGFGGWPWGRHDPVHGRGAQRFAQHADGRREEPA